MPFATFEGEGSVEEIADRLFVRLTPRQRETATAELLRANPNLERIRTVERGTVLNVPDIPALRAKATESNESPDARMLQLLAASVDTYGGRLAERQAADAAEIKAQSAAINTLHPRDLRLRGARRPRRRGARLARCAGEGSGRTAAGTVEGAGEGGRGHRQAAGGEAAP